MPWHSGRSRPCGSLPPSGGRRVKPSRCISVMSDLAPIDRLPRSSWRRTVWRNTLKRGWPTGDADVHDGCEGRELKQERKADLSRRTHPCNSSMKYLPVKTNFRADRTFPYTPRLNLSIALSPTIFSLTSGARPCQAATSSRSAASVQTWCNHWHLCSTQVSCDETTCEIWDAGAIPLV